MSAFSTVRVPSGCPELSNNYTYFKTQFAFSFFKGFGWPELLSIYDLAVVNGEDTIWVPTPKGNKIGLSTWYVKALIENTYED